MTSVLVVSGDATIRNEVRACATAAGVRVIEYTELGAAGRDWTGAMVVFLGADLGEAAMRTPPPPVRELIIISNGTRTPPFRLAATLGAAYVALLPVARSWLTERIGRAASEARNRRPEATFGESV